MEVLTKPSKVVATASEILNHSCWSEQLDRRRKLKGHGNRVFRHFSLHCGGNCEIVCYLSEVIGFSLGACKFSKPFVEVELHALERYGAKLEHSRFIHLNLLEWSESRTEFNRKLYAELCKRFALTDWDVQNCKVEEV